MNQNYFNQMNQSQTSSLNNQILSSSDVDRMMPRNNDYIFTEPPHMGVLQISDNLKKLLDIIRLVDILNEKICQNCDHRYLNPLKKTKKSNGCSKIDRDNQTLNNFGQYSSERKIDFKSQKFNIKQLTLLIQDKFEGTAHLNDEQLSQLIQLNLFVEEIKQSAQSLINQELIRQKFKDENDTEVMACRYCWKVYKQSMQLGGHLSKVHPGCSDDYLERQNFSRHKKIEDQRRNYFMGLQNLAKKDCQQENIQIENQFKALPNYRFNDILSQIHIHSFSDDEIKQDEFKDKMKTKKIKKNGKINPKNKENKEKQQFLSQNNRQHRKKNTAKKYDRKNLR